MNIKELRQHIERKKGQAEQIQSALSITKTRIKHIQKEVTSSEKAQLIIQTVAKQTQEKLQFHISNIVSLALVTIFDEPYEFKVNFVTKRNKTECELLFERNGKTINPLLASGGGVVDVTSFALRISLWTLQNPKSRNVFLLDEPFKCLSSNLLPKIKTLLEELKNRLNIQFIIVTHSKELFEIADRKFDVSIKKGISKIEVGV